LVSSALCEASTAGDGVSLLIRTEKPNSSVCDRLGTVPFRSFPLNTSAVLEMHLCADHFRALLGRRLGPMAFQVLQRRLEKLRLRADQIFLLHEVFYDSLGRALQPVDDVA